MFTAMLYSRGLVIRCADDTRTSSETSAEDHEAFMKHVFQDLLGVELTDAAWARVQLPGPLSGMGLVLPKTYADAVFVSTWQALADKVVVVIMRGSRATHWIAV